MKRWLFLVVGAAVITTGENVLAGGTTLPLRLEAGTCTYNGSTVQTVETSFGTAVAALSYSGTTTYDFYSPPLSAATSLGHSDKGTGTVFMKNTGALAINDFTVTARMRFYDYDPASRANLLLVDTTASANKVITHNMIVSWALPNSTLLADATMPAGHLLHLAVTITLIGGNPNGVGQFLYNGPSGSTSIAQLPQNRASTWVFAPLTGAPDATITAPSSVWAGSATNTASVAAVTGAAYAWTITNGTITAGQATPQITWTAGSSGPVKLQVAVTKGCASSGSTQVSVAANVQPPPSSPVLAISQLADGTTRLTCSGAPVQAYAIQATTDLAAPVWTTLTTATTDANGWFSFVDLNAPNYPSRFYRAQAPYNP